MERTAGDKILAELERQNCSLRWLANQTGVADRTLTRKVTGIAAGELLNLGELRVIAKALDVPAWSLLPDSFLAIATPGGRSVK